MQLYAFDENESIVSASHAQKQKDYVCLECRGVVRMRSGLHRQKHFYHLRPTESCFLSGKTIVHLQVQKFLYDLLPKGTCHLEHRFPSINRIADLAWHSEKLIFEVQCSEIKAEEVLSRNRDYASIGYQVVWIFHDRRYNRWRLSAAESALRNSPHYFTNMDENGLGIIYDQFDTVVNGIRRHVQKPLPIDPSKPIKIKGISWGFKLVRERLSNWPVRFEGDITTLASRDPYVLKAQEAEKGVAVKEEKDFSRYIKKYVLRPYYIFFQILLERACH